MREGLKKFIVVEGPDGVGKGTQVRLLVEWLQSLGFDVWETHEPTNGPYGQEIRQILGKQKPMLEPTEFQMLYVCDRREHQTEISKALLASKTVVCDRYYYSTLAYGAVAGADVERLHNEEKDFLKPDVTLWLNLDSEAARARMESRGVMDTLDKDLSFQQSLQREYAKLAVGNPEVVEVDASGAPEEVHRRVREILTRRLGIG